jgi:hypothetical protein
MINPLFQFHKLNDEGQKKAIGIAEAFSELLEKLNYLATGSQVYPVAPPNCRELAIVKTKLEEACFFAKKAMAVLPENQQQDAFQLAAAARAAGPEEKY